MLWYHCIIPSWWVTFWTHPETIPVGQFFQRWIKSIQARRKGRLRARLWSTAGVDCSHWIKQSMTAPSCTAIVLLKNGTGRQRLKMSHFDLCRFKAIPDLSSTIFFYTVAAFDCFFSYFNLIIHPWRWAATAKLPPTSQLVWRPVKWMATEGVTASMTPVCVKAANFHSLPRR